MSAIDQFARLSFQSGWPLHRIRYNLKKSSPTAAPPSPAGQPTVSGYFTHQPARRRAAWVAAAVIANLRSHVRHASRTATTPARLPPRCQDSRRHRFDCEAFWHCSNATASIPSSKVAARLEPQTSLTTTPPSVPPASLYGPINKNQPWRRPLLCAGRGVSPAAESLDVRSKAAS